jgi:integrase
MPTATHLPLLFDSHEALLRQARALNSTLRRRGTTGFAVVAFPPPAGDAPPYQVWFGLRRLTLPISGAQVRAYLDGAELALELCERVPRPSPRPAPRLPRAAAAGGSGELAGLQHAAELLNARMGLPPEWALGVLAPTEPVIFVKGQAYLVISGDRRRTISMSANGVYLFLDGMNAALDIQAAAASQRARRPATAPDLPPVLPSSSRGARGRRPSQPSPPHSSDGAPAARRPHPGAAAPAATRRAYEGDLDYFWSWAAVELGLPEAYPVPLAAVVQFVADHLGGLPAATDRALVESGVKTAPGPHRPATVARRLASLSAAHQALGVTNPCLEPEPRELVTRARRARAADAGAAARPAAATSYEPLQALLGAGESADLAGRRGRALLVLAWAAGGVRRGELARARVEDLAPVQGGFLFRRSSPPARGTPAIPILGPAAEALAAWLTAANLTSGPLFRPIHRRGRVGAGPLSAYGVALLLKQEAERNGLDPALLKGAVPAGPLRRTAPRS